MGPDPHTGGVRGGGVGQYRDQRAMRHRIKYVSIRILQASRISERYSYYDKMMCVRKSSIRDRRC